jgi:hypothetical protein
MAYLAGADPEHVRERGAVSGTGAGDNPSTWAGGIVLAAVVGLVILRRGFRNFM